MSGNKFPKSPDLQALNHTFTLPQRPDKTTITNFQSHQRKDAIENPEDGTGQKGKKKSKGKGDVPEGITPERQGYLLSVGQKTRKTGRKANKKQDIPITTEKKTHRDHLFE